ncbi:MAG: formate dehydrogenase accessory sulfurtransferase FdhD [Dehalococcoidales bacterium]|nr:formate dehydrogenase accessory sulfurtransferase FdhD [Dehalococcoidales bacterium]
MDKLLKKVKITRVNDKGVAAVSENIIKETSLIININGRRHAKLVTLLGKQVKELVVGHLFSQGIINQAKDIKSLIITNNTADIILKKGIVKQPVKDKIKSALKVTKEDIFNCVNAVLKSKIFDKTEAVHSAGLFLHGKEPVAIAEDIGRHHAMDKVIGTALLQGIPLNETVIASTGRMTSEMVGKICRAGIPIIATKAAVTDRGVKLAKENGVTLVGFVRDAGTTMNTDMSVRVFKEAGMKIYSGASRIHCD